MQRFLLFFITEKSGRDLLMSTVQRVLQSQIVGNNCALTSAPLCYVAIVQPLSSDQVNDTRSTHQFWTPIKDEYDCCSLIKSINSQDFNVESLAENIADSLHLLADRLPSLGTVTDVIWLLENVADFHENTVYVYGALKRFCEWQNAMITIIHYEGCAIQASPVLRAWSENLRAQLLPISNELILSLWHGSIVLAGSQRTVKLPGFHLIPLSKSMPYAMRETNLGIRADEDCRNQNVCMSSIMNFVAEIDFNEIPSFYLTSNCYLLDIVSQAEALNCSRLFLNRLAVTPNLCYILRLSFGSEWKQMKSVSEEAENTRSWHQLIKENVSHASENPFAAELSGRLGCIHFLIRSFQLCDIADTKSSRIYCSSSHSANQYVAIRMRDVVDFNGAVAHTLAQNVVEDSRFAFKLESGCSSILPKELSHSLRSFSSEDLLLSESLLNHTDSEGFSPTTLTEDAQLIADTSVDITSNSSGVFHKPTSDCGQDVHVLERQMLSFSTSSDSGDEGLQLARQTLGKLSPPTKRKVIVLTAGEISKFFNGDGTAVKDCKIPVALKKPARRLFRYNSIEDDGGLRFASWPNCLLSRYHDVFYNTCNAEVVERQCNRLKYQLGNNETASLCSADQQNIHLPQPLVVPSNRALQTGFSVNKYSSQRSVSLKDDKISNSQKKRSIRDCNSHENCGGSSSAFIKGSDLEGSTSSVSVNECKKQQKNKDVVLSQSVQQPSKQMRVSKSLNDYHLKVEPRSLRHRRKMEEVVKETLLAYDVDTTSSFYEPCFKRLCTITETFVKDLPTSRGLREEMYKIAQQYAAHTIDFEKSCQQRFTSAVKR